MKPSAPDYFTCPNCGGHLWGRDMRRVESGVVWSCDTVRCHDEHETGCTWRGVWPKGEATDAS